VGVTDAATTEDTRPTRARLPRFPALDGLKGLAVLAVVAFDLGTKWARGGDLGVSTLFTLTGFLAMASMLAARGDSHAIGLRSFWDRRVRRILGPTLVALAIAVVFGFTAAAAIQRQHLAVDGITSLLSVANWRFILDHQAFGPATDLASPARQFWAFAVIGQVLLVVSLLTALTLDRAHWARERLGAILAVLVVASTAMVLVWHHSPTRILYGTDTRAAEVLVGCVLAIVIYDPRITIRLAIPGPVRDTINAAGVIGGVALLACWSRLAPNSVVIRDGGLLLVALLSASVVLASIVPDGPVSSLLAITPLRWLGRIAIVLYLVHWPIYVWIDREHTGLRGNVLIATRLVAAFAAAIVVQFAFDWIQDRRPAADGDRRDRHGLLTSALAVVAVVAALVAVTVTGPSVGSATDVETAGATSPTTAAAAPPTVAFYGDALASTLETAARAYGDRTGKIKVVDGVASPTCGIDRDQLVRDPSGAETPLPAECSTWDTRWQSAVTAQKPDVAVVVTGITELDDHRQPTDPAYTGPGDNGYDYQLLLLMHKAVDLLSASGTKVIWLNLPNFTSGSGSASDSLRVAAFDKLLTSVGQELPGQVTIADLAGWTPNNGGPGAEPSDQGWGASAADHVVQDFLVPKILAAWSAAHSSAPTSTATTSTIAAPTTVATVPPPAGVDPTTKPTATKSTATKTKRSSSTTVRANKSLRRPTTTTHP
jgi:peptidoglycan/LPS O-acetylase OafA/YrhL